MPWTPTSRTSAIAKLQQIGDNEIWSNLKPAHEQPKRTLQLVWLSDTPSELFWKAGPSLEHKELIDGIVFCVCMYRLKCREDRGTHSPSEEDRGTQSPSDSADRLCCLTVQEDRGTHSPSDRLCCLTKQVQRLFTPDAMGPTMHNSSVCMSNCRIHWQQGSKLDFSIVNIFLCHPWSC